MQMAVSMWMRLQREAHLLSLIFKDGFLLAEGSLFFEITTIVLLVSGYLEILDPESASSAAHSASNCLQLSMHLSEFLAKSI